MVLLAAVEVAVALVHQVVKDSSAAVEVDDVMQEDSLLPPYNEAVEFLHDVAL